MKNFSLVEKTSPFTKEDLVFVTSKGQVRPMLSLPAGEKIFQLHYRQTAIIQNYKKIANLNTKKKMISDQRAAELDIVIQKFVDRIIILHTEIAKIRAAALIDSDPEIKDLPQYEEFLRVDAIDPFEKLSNISTQNLVDHQIMERILLENSSLFLNFVGQVLVQGEESTIVPALAKISQKFGYKLIKEKELAE